MDPRNDGNWEGTLIWHSGCARIAWRRTGFPVLKGLMVISRNAREIMKLVSGRKPSYSDDENDGLQIHHM